MRSSVVAVVGDALESKKTVALWMVGGVVLGIAGLLVTYYLMTNEYDLFRVTTQGQDISDLACGTPFDHPEWDSDHPCQEAMQRQFAAAGLFGLASLGIVVGSLVVGLRRMGSSGESGTDSSREPTTEVSTEPDIEN